MLQGIQMASSALLTLRVCTPPSDGAIHVQTSRVSCRLVGCNSSESSTPAGEHFHQRRQVCSVRPRWQLPVRQSCSGNHKLTVEASRVRKGPGGLHHATGQNLNLPITLHVGSVSDSVTVTTEAPLVDSADSRTELTLENKGVAQLPIVGRNLVTLVTMAPGVSGLGTSTSGSPASAQTISQLRSRWTQAQTAKVRTTISTLLMVWTSAAESGKAF